MTDSGPANFVLMRFAAAVGPAPGAAQLGYPGDAHTQAVGQSQEGIDQLRVVCLRDLDERRAPHRADLVRNLHPALRRFLVAHRRHELRQADALHLVQEGVRQDVALHLLRLEEHQVHRILGNRSQARVDAFLEALQFALLQEGLGAFDGPLAEDGTEDALGFFFPLPQVREVVLVERGELVLAQFLYGDTMRIEDASHGIGDLLQRRIGLRIAHLHAVDEIQVFIPGACREQLARFLQRLFRARKGLRRLGRVLAQGQACGVGIGRQSVGVDVFADVVAEGDESIGDDVIEKRGRLDRRSGVNRFGPGYRRAA